VAPFEIEDIFEFQNLHSISGSTEHSRTVFVVSQADQESDAYISTLWTLDIAGDDGPRQLTPSGVNPSSPLLDGAGHRVAFLSRRGNDSLLQVHVLAFKDGEALRLTDSRRELQSIVAWAADGSRLLATAKVPWAEDAGDDTAMTDGRPKVVTFLPYKLDGTGTVVGHRTHLVSIDAATGDERLLVGGDFDIAAGQWSPDGNKLAFVRSRSGTQRHLQDLWIANADGSDPRQVTRDLVTIGGIRWSPDGRSIAFAGSTREGDSVSHLWVYDLHRDCAVRPCGEDLELEGATFVWHGDGRRLATIAMHRGLHQVATVDMAAGTVRYLDPGLCHVTALCANADRLLTVSASLRWPDELVSIDWEGRDRREHGAFNRPWFETRERPRVEKRAFDVPDGAGGVETIDAWVLRPATGDGPFPLLLDLHGGPHSDVLIDFASHVYWYRLLSTGWAIVAPNAVGSAGYGSAFARRLIGRWGELDMPQHLAVVRALQTEGVASQRVACAGKSYGGYLSAWALGHSDIFEAAVISAPLANLESHTGTSDTGYYVGPYAMGAELDGDRARYHRLSPIQALDPGSTPALVLQGEDDQRCPLGQSEELFAALIRRGNTDSKLVVYPGGSHLLAGTGRPSHRLDYHRRLVGWVDGTARGGLHPD